MIINIILPRGHQLDYNYLKNQIIQLTADKCRQIEQVAKHMRLYSLNAYNYAIYVEPKDKADADRIVEQVIEILEAPTNYSLNNHSLVYKMIVFGNHHFIDSTQKLASMQKYLFAKLGNDMKNEHYVATKKDYDDFVTLYNIENLLSDIKSDMNLDDERVICYAQPIYSVETNSFRTAEALMRLDLNGTMIYPDKFIPLAEQNGSIHALTCIILNKVCEKIHELSAEYDFDAITVNCSTLEFSNKDLYKELLDIIRGNDIDCSKIRLELTESAMSDSYELLSANIHKLMDAGIQFYLDDFGTGYSNLERIIGCPFNTIKFDKSLLYKSMDDERMDDLIKSLSEVFKKHGFTLLVEGVENDEQNQYSIKRGFSYIQGYKYAKPVPIAELTSYFQLAQRIV
jgi:EAL domain-containing protein (putative c-di-GMP-specific phosphodiesterase class I)